MSTENSTATIAVSKPAKKVKDVKLAAEKQKVKDLGAVLAESAEKIRLLEAQKDVAERKAVSDSHDTKRVANAMLVIEMITDMHDGDKDIPASHLGRIQKQLEKEFSAPALKIQAH